jgi:hypothetical protein
MVQCHLWRDGKRCENKAEWTLVGYDHDLERVSPGRILNKGLIEGYRAYVCDTHKESAKDFMLHRHFRVIEKKGIHEAEKT